MITKGSMNKIIPPLIIPKPMSKNMLAKFPVASAMYPEKKTSVAALRTSKIGTDPNSIEYNYPK